MSHFWLLPSDFKNIAQEIFLSGGLDKGPPAALGFVVGRSLKRALWGLGLFSAFVLAFSPMPWGRGEAERPFPVWNHLRNLSKCVGMEGISGHRYKPGIRGYKEALEMEFERAIIVSSKTVSIAISALFTVFLHFYAPFKAGETLDFPVLEDSITALKQPPG